MTTRPQGAPRPIVGRPSGNVRIGGFLGDVVSELRKVVWPTREEATRLTIMVVVVAVIVGVALGLIDLGFGALVRQVLIG